jgi:hypothetical protein
MLEQQCSTWGGIISVAVYFPLIYFQSANADKLREAITRVENFHEQIDRNHGGAQLQPSPQPSQTFSLQYACQLAAVCDVHAVLCPCAGMCRLDIVLVSEIIKQHDLWAYPYNALRNQALSRAETDVSSQLSCLSQAACDASGAAMWQIEPAHAAAAGD